MLTQAHNMCVMNTKGRKRTPAITPSVHGTLGKHNQIFPLVPAAAAKSLQSCQTLCDSIDSSPPGSPIPGILQARIRSGLPFPSPMHEVKSESEVAQSCPTLRDPMDCSPPGSSIHGIFQARVLEWVAIAFSIPLVKGLHFIDNEQELINSRI